MHTIELACLPLGGLALPCYELIKNEGPRIIDEIANNSVISFFQIVKSLNIQKSQNILQAYGDGLIHN